MFACGTWQGAASSRLPALDVGRVKTVQLKCYQIQIMKEIRHDSLCNW